MDNAVRQVLGKNGLATQCIQIENAISAVVRNKEVILKQLCFKINSKMGGVNNAISENTITRLVSLPYQYCYNVSFSSLLNYRYYETFITMKGFDILHWRRGLGLIYLFIDQRKYAALWQSVMNNDINSSG